MKIKIEIEIEIGSFWQDCLFCQGYRKDQDCLWLGILLNKFIGTFPGGDLHDWFSHFLSDTHPEARLQSDEIWELCSQDMKRSTDYDV